MDTETGINRRHILTVSELTSLIKSTLEGSFPDVWVEGEIYNLRIPSSGHVYFTIKDNSSQIRAVIFRSSARTIRFIPKDGLHVLCRGRITIYEFRGEYQLIVDYMEPMGVGALLLAFEQLKKRLSEEGLFDEARKRPIPILPQKIGIVTSPTGAAIRDILKVIERRFANVEIVIAPALVQGERAAPEIVDAIRELNNIDNIEVIILARGGGGIEDLWPFNEEIVARAIYNSKIPVISAVGHEIDYTIADFVADLRAPTPSAAAEMVVKNKEDMQGLVRALYSRLAYARGTFFEKRRERLKSIMQRILSPEQEINRYIQRLDDIDNRVTAGVKRIIKDRRLHVEGLIKLLDSLSPLSILARGYSITYKLPSRTLIKSSADVHRGDKVDIKLHEGNIICVVENPQNKD
ncbi:MAG TPA: exodeoxyribonuclease VII large subunit [Nitrospiraceae bacterium]|nr:MAG: exodeoxyribonuclease VII large subunit [Nitrospirae bacterium RIFCSPHIGHO2_02_FULL_42_12]HBI23336.1 exodeoxyribonuclease VII large subunit [Nitrospiraceae bacterium]